MKHVQVLLGAGAWESFIKRKIIKYYTAQIVIEILVL